MIQQSMKEIQQLFFDLALLVDEQNEMIDYVQLNVFHLEKITTRLTQLMIEQIGHKRNYKTLLNE